MVQNHLTSICLFLFAIKHTLRFLRFPAEPKMSKDNLVLQYNNMSTSKVTVTDQGRWAKVGQALRITWHSIEVGGKFMGIYRD